MGREGRLAEELRALAADQGSNPGAYREEDNGMDEGCMFPRLLKIKMWH